MNLLPNFGEFFYPGSILKFLRPTPTPTQNFRLCPYVFFLPSFKGQGHIEGQLTEKIHFLVKIRLGVSTEVYFRLKASLRIALINCYVLHLKANVKENVKLQKNPISVGNEAGGLSKISC